MLILAHTIKEVSLLGGDLKKRKQVGVVMDIQIYERLKKYSDESMIPMSRIIDRAVVEYLERNEKK